MAAEKFSIGLDFGTNSVRALIVDVNSGAEVATVTHDYCRGDHGVFSSPSDPHVARQHPADYHEGAAGSVVAALEEARGVAGFSADQVVGIGVDTTGSTPIPVDEDGLALGLHPSFHDDPDAYAWLWKDHSSVAEAERITALAAEHRPAYLGRCGGVYSSEWFWSKILHCRNVAPNVFAAARSWVELCDYIPAQLTGVTAPAQIRRSVCAAGHKAMFAREWGGLPDTEFLAMLHPDLADLRSRLYDEAFSSDVRAGGLSEQWAHNLGLPAGIAVAVGAFDVHHGAVGAGITPGALVKAIGTSTCDITLAPGTAAESPLLIPGVCGIVDGSVLPGRWGIAAGQSGVGDILNWFVTHVCEGDARTHEILTAEAARLQPGESGLLALDWHNGNRTVLVDARLTGLMLGQTLHTTRAEMYRALIEALAFGAHTIHQRIGEYVPLERIVACGGITLKNPMFMQILADVTGQQIEVAASTQTCALGAAIFGAVAGGAYARAEEAQARMASRIAVIYRPDPARHATYGRIYGLYRQLHDTFGVPGHSESLYNVMKTLLEIRRSVTV